MTAKPKGVKSSYLAILQLISKKRAISKPKGYSFCFSLQHGRLQVEVAFLRS